MNSGSALISRAKKDKHTQGRVLAVAGGKGGVGKTVVSIILAEALARRGERVVLADLDLGAANLHTYLGIHRDTPGIADFLAKKAAGMEELLLTTDIPGVRLISGARFYPGMTNPSHQTKLKLIRHLRRLPADTVILDLGAGVNFNTLDFFSISRPGLLTLAPEPGSVLNAYSFVKGGLFRHLMHVFGKHPDLGPVLDEARTREGEDNIFSVSAFKETVRGVDDSLAPLVDEIIDGFQLALVMNQVSDLVSAVYADNLQKLVLQRLLLKVFYLGNIPEIKGLSRHLVGMPGFLAGRDAEEVLEAADELLVELDRLFPVRPAGEDTERSIGYVPGHGSGTQRQEGTRHRSNEGDRTSRCGPRRQPSRPAT